MTGIIAGMGAKAVLSAVGARLGKISPRAWLVMGCAVALLVGVLWHRHEVKVTIAAAKAEQKATDDAAAKKLADHALALAAKVNALTANISTLIRTKTDETLASNAASAADLVRGGPGKAGVCRPLVPAAPGGHDASPPDRGASGPVLPPPDIAAVPWTWLVGRAQEHDDLLAEDQAWRDWYAKMIAAWPKASPPPQSP